MYIATNSICLREVGLVTTSTPPFDLKDKEYAEILIIQGRIKKVSSAKEEKQEKVTKELKTPARQTKERKVKTITKSSVK